MNGVEGFIHAGTEQAVDEARLPNQRTIPVTVEGIPSAVASGTTLESLAAGRKGTSGALIVAAFLNNEIRELTYEVKEPCSIRFVDLSSEDGIRIYQRSLKFLLIKGLHDCYPDRDVAIRHSVSKGIFFDVVGPPLGPEEVRHLERHMRELVARDVPFEKVIVSLDEARRIFLSSGREDRDRAVRNREKDYVSLYLFEDVEDYFYGYMVPGSGYLKLFELEAAEGGIVLVIPKKEKPDRLPEGKIPGKLFNIFAEYTNWIHILGVDDVGHLNERVKNGQTNDFIRIAEALHEKKIASIADQVKQDAGRVRIILIAGPSSSGKTTFAQRLSVQLRVNGIMPVNISVDDYFVNQDATPRDESGNPDFEALECVDLPLFNRDLQMLADGGEIIVPAFNFTTGKREYLGRKLKLEPGQVMVVEGIHALNPRLSDAIRDESKFRIYVSAITSMQIDRHNRIPTTDLRLIRRLVRDHRTRGAGAPKTLGMWASVRKGEELNIFPYQELADVMFNSSLIYELGVMKQYALPLLQGLEPDLPVYSEARRLIEFLSYFENIGTEEIPRTSILREFIGGSSFSA
jgi:uridine kinase